MFLSLTEDNALIALSMGVGPSSTAVWVLILPKRVFHITARATHAICLHPYIGPTSHVGLVVESPLAESIRVDDVGPVA